MPVLLLILFIAVPIAEIAIFIQAGERFGLWPTLGLVILTAILGTTLLRYQGSKALHRVQESLNRGEMPIGEVFTGLCLLVAGALLLTPGFLTDGVGFAYLFRVFAKPSVRIGEPSHVPRGCPCLNSAIAARL